MDIADLNRNASTQGAVGAISSVSGSYTSLSQNARTNMYPIDNVRRSAHSTEHKSRLFSPYIAPSAVNVENKALAQASAGPIYQHNIAVTKYYNVSTTPKPRTNQSMNVLA